MKISLRKTVVYLRSEDKRNGPQQNTGARLEMLCVQNAKIYAAIRGTSKLRPTER